MIDSEFQDIPVSSKDYPKPDMAVTMAEPDTETQRPTMWAMVREAFAKTNGILSQQAQLIIQLKQRVDQLEAEVRDLRHTHHDGHHHDHRPLEQAMTQLAANGMLYRGELSEVGAPLEINEQFQDGDCLVVANASDPNGERKYFSFELAEDGGYFNLLAKPEGEKVAEFNELVESAIVKMSKFFQENKEHQDCPYFLVLVRSYVITGAPLNEHSVRVEVPDEKEYGNGV